MSKNVRCVISECKMRCPAVKYHRFPTEPLLLKKWIKFTGKRERQPNWSPSKNHAICSAHFRKECLDSNHVLHPRAYPTLNAPKVKKHYDKATIDGIMLSLDLKPVPSKPAAPVLLGQLLEESESDPDSPPGSPGVYPYPYIDEDAIEVTTSDTVATVVTEDIDDTEDFERPVSPMEYFTLEQSEYSRVPSPSACSESFAFVDVNEDFVEEEFGKGSKVMLSTAPPVKSPTTNKKNHLVWFDLEMTGLDPAVDHIMEAACLVTDADLNVIGEGVDLIIHQPDEILSRMNDWCKDHHGQSGLTEACRKSTVTLNQAEDRLLSYLEKNTIKGASPLAGNTVYMDRLFIAKYLPKVDEHMHYRIVDVSSVKELCRRWAPKTYDGAPKKKLAHRAQIGRAHV